jgi:Na+-translocating ferredoxin:NAD+ oxidoreductase RNF subunit RnfB
MAVGFPSTDSGVEIRLLKHLFTPEEAEVALHLSMVPESVERIYTRMKNTGISIEKLEQLLDEMVHKGNTWSIKRDDKNYYQNAMLTVGMYEFQVDRLTRDFSENMRTYFKGEFGKEMYRTKTPLMRTIPVRRSVSPTQRYQVSTYDDVQQLIQNSNGKLAVANCVCRQARDVMGKSCKHTDLRETCLVLEDWADYYINAGIARPITRDEALDILDKIEADSLVLQPENSQRPGFICACCGDCCGILATVKRFPRPADLYATNYCAVVYEDLCTACEECISHCQLQAISLINDIANVNPDRCIGCGNCITRCPSNALQLKKKEEETVPPKDGSALYNTILSRKTGGWHTFKVKLKSLLGIQV